MKRAKYIKFALSLCSIIISLSQSTGQQLYNWNAQSGRWNDSQNWIVNDHQASQPPGKNDVVHIAAHQDVEITIDNPINVAALATTGSGKIDFKSNKNIHFDVENWVVLSAFTTAQNGVEVNVKNEDKFPSYTHQGQPFGKYLNTPNNTHPAGKGTSRSTCSFFTIVPNPSPPACNGSHNGIASIEEPTDGVGPYLYQWVGGPQTRQWNNVGAGTYTIIVIDLGQGTSCNTDVFLNEPGPLTVFSMNGTPPLCADACDGTAAPIVIGGNGGYTLNWSSGESGFTANQLCASFSLNITDQKGCSFDTTYTYTNAPEPIQINADITAVHCFGDNNGKIDITITGGTGISSYQWSGPSGFTSTDKDIENLAPGNYTLSVSDANGCSENATFSVSENPLLKATSSKIDNVCGMGADGEISVSPSGGLPPYNFNWNGPNGFTSTDQNIDNLESGLYELTIIDDAGCDLTMQVTISEPSEITVSTTSVHVKCNGNNEGEITASASGGTPPFNYNWSGPNGFSASGPGITGIIAGTYTVVVTDSKDCEGQATVIINEPDLITVDFTIDEITCHNGNDGSVQIQVEGGTPGYSYTWTGPGGFTATTANITQLIPGSYTLTVKDQNDCEMTSTVDVQNPQTIDISAQITDNACTISADGAIHPQITGGEPPYLFSWTGPSGFASNNDELNNLKNGTYNLILTDANGCEATASFTITAPNAVTATFNVTHTSCFDATDGAIALHPSGGAEPYTFVWVGPAGFFSQQQNISNLAGGNYSVQILDANGCMTFLSATVNQPPKIVLAGTVTHATCFGGANGSATPVISGGTGNFTYSWTGPNGFTSTSKNITGLAAGTYTLTATDKTGCSKSKDYIINQPAEILINGAIENVTCAGSSDGAIEIAITNGIPPYTYSWSGPGGFSASTKNIENLHGGNYTVTVTDSKNCYSQNTFTVNESIVITVEAQITPISCFGEDDAEIQVGIDGGGEPYSLNWTGPNGFTSTATSIQNLAPGFYELNIVDNNGCEVIYPVTIDEPQELTASVAIHNISCFGLNDGSLTANGVGGTQPYEFSWVGPSGFNSQAHEVTNLEPGSYQVVISDKNGCIVTETVQIHEPDDLALNIDITEPGCMDDDGALTANVTGGTITGNYEYKWIDNGGAVIGTDATLTNLPPGSYIITVTDDNGCELSESVMITRSTLTVNAEVQDADCFGTSTGSIGITPATGTAPFNYSWSGPEGFHNTNSNIENLSAGTYQLTISDAGGCVLNLEYEISQPDEIEIVAAITPESCVGENDGSIALQVSGGTPGYSVVWAGPGGFTQNGLSATNLAPGTYVVDVSDIEGCFQTAIFEVLEAQDFSVNILATSPICANEPTGSIEVEATPVGNYTYIWMGPNGYAATSANLSQLHAGKYYLKVTNESGCSKIDSTELSMPDPIIIDLQTTGSTCQQQDGSAEVTVSGGVGTLSVKWYDHNNNEIATGTHLSSVFSGIYTVRVEDDQGCIVTQTVVISDGSGSIEGIVSLPSCSGASDGSIEISILNASAPFTYEWTKDGAPFPGEEILENLTSGVYVVTVTDDTGCIYIQSFDIEDPGAIGVVAHIYHISCDPWAGQITLQISNATNPTVTWIGPNGYTATGTTIQHLEAGIYNYEISTDQGCARSGNIEIETVDEIEISAQIKNVLCGGDNSGYIDLTITAGLPPFEYHWSGPNGFESNSQDIADIFAGDYTVTITDDNGCDVIKEFTIAENEAISAEYEVVHPGCNETNGSISVTLSGGVITTDYFVSWTDEDGNPLPPATSLTNLGVGVYHFTGSDDNGCTLDTIITLSNPDADIGTVTTNVSCPDANDGTITLEVDGVDGPYTVSWSGPNGYTSQDENLTDLEPGEYHYTITGANLCEYLGSAEILPPAELNVISQILPSCADMSSGEITLFLSGVSGPFTFQWSGPNGFSSSNQNIANLEGGQYEVEISYGATCLQTFDFTVNENTAIIIDVLKSDILCFGDGLGSIEVEISGGAPPFSFGWTGPNGFESSDLEISGLSSGLYLFTVEDDLGCIKDVEVEINEPELLSLNETIIAPGCSSIGNGGVIETDVTGGEADYTISWTGPNGFTSSDFMLLNLVPGTYSYTLIDGNGCEITGEVEMPEENPLIADVWSQSISCFGESNGEAGITISGGIEPFQILWEGPGSFTSQDSEIHDLSAGTYTIRVFDAGGCSILKTIQIVEPEAIAIEIIETQDASCSTSQDGSIEIEVAGGTAPYHFEWLGEDGFNSQDQNISQLKPGLYDLGITDNNGCLEHIQVEVSYLLEVSVHAGDDISICHSDLPFILEGSGINVDDLLWSDIDGNSLSENAISKNTIPGSYSFVLTGSNGFCSAADTLVVTIIAGPDVDAGQDKEVFAEQIFRLGGNPTSTSGTAFLWSPQAMGSFHHTDPNPEGYLTETTTFIVEVKDENGCISIDSVTVVILPNVGIYSGFSPNGDGVNDKWIIDNIELFPNSVVHVFNRWGQMVYEQKSYNSGNAWDGTFEGKKLPVGTYYYTIDLKDERFPDKLTGPITIYR